MSRAARATANSSRIGRPPPRATPRDNTIEAGFEQPFRLVAVQIFNGASRDDAKYLTIGRPARVLLTITTSKGSLELRELTLRDDPRQQDHLIGLNDVTKVKMTIQSVFGGSKSPSVALGEMAFFTRA